MTQQEALDILKSGNNVFLTGSPGSGKTFLLNEYINFLKNKGVAVGVTASTGIAATHMSGITIHSWAGIGIKDELQEADLSKMLKNGRLRRRLSQTKVLIIDEISMLHSFRLDMVDYVCKMLRQDIRPFGGIQVVLSGDFFQLPPVSRGDEKAEFVDKSQIWNEMNLKVCYLSDQYRQTEDDGLAKVLNDIRTNNAGEHTLDILMDRYQKDIKGHIRPTKLFTHNADVDTVNYEELSKIQGTIKKYVMRIIGTRKLAEILIKSCLAPEELKLKKGAMVMFVKNNFDKGYVNGTLGRVIDFDEYSMPVVETFQGDKITATAESWIIEEEGKTKAEIVQIPLRLAWAITVHKSQGMTLDGAEIDLSKCFTEGMGYVGLSRVRSLSGLRLMGINDLALKINEDMLKLDESLVQISKINTEEIQGLDAKEKAIRQMEFLNSIIPAQAEKKEMGKKKENKVFTQDITKKLVDQKFSISEIAKSREVTEGTVFSHLEKIVLRGDDIDLEYLRPKTERFEQIIVAFQKSGDTKLAPVKEILGDDFSYDEIRIGRLFL
ncbi:MAG: helix-turn-helix domain-containing protein [Patescibacteria group bacterium]